MTSTIPAQYRHVLSPLAVGLATIKNRTVVTAHTYGLLDGTEAGRQAMAEYVGARIDGGVGMIVLGETIAMADAAPAAAEWGAAVSTNGLVPLYRLLAERAERHGATVIEQLYHPGGQVWHEEGLVAVAPSVVPHTRSYVLPREADDKDLTDIVDGFAAAARRAAEGGLDGVELKCDQGKLHHQFLSARYNFRTDGYGGSLVRRSRLVRETLDRTRATIGEGIVGVRLPSGVNAPAAAGRSDLSVDEVAEIVRILGADGVVDYVSFSIDTNSTAWGYWQGHPDEYASTIAAAPLLARACRLAELPIVLTGSVTSLDVADRMVADGTCDLVGMTRAHIADPQLVAKSTAGHAGAVIPCVACNQGCVGNTWYGNPIRCSVNPVTGRESTVRLRRRTSEPKGHVTVLGAGPAGLEAARRLGLAGVRVRLHEKSAMPGGQWRAASSLPGRLRFASWLDQVIEQIGTLDMVEMLFDSELSVDSPEIDHAAGVIVATGASVPKLATLDGASGVLTAEEAIQRDTSWQGARILLIDGERRKDCLGVAELLLERGAYVHVVTPFDAVGLGLDPVTLTSRMSRLLRAATPMTTWSELVGFQDGVAELYNQITNKIVQIPGWTGVVLSVNGVPDVPSIRGITRACGIQDIPVRVVGDAQAPRGFEVAIREGFDAVGELMEAMK